MKRLLLATRNLHKVGEIQSMLEGLFECISLREFSDVPEVVEDADTFEGNARKKADTIAGWVGQQGRDRIGVPPDFVLADDSGLEVDALDGAPGVHSARFAALDTDADGNSSDADNNAKLLRLLADVPAEKRTGRFRCVLVLVPVGQGASGIFDGSCEGHIRGEAHGDQGFGYDPLFVPDGFQQTFAELGEATKNQISHRSKALGMLRQAHKSALA